jgi:hypothetical protein
MHSFAILDDRRGGKGLTHLFVAFLALAISTPVLFAQELNHINGPHKTDDPTGVWFVRTSLHIPLPTSQAAFAIIVFHDGGTITEDVQGEGGFDPSAVPVPPTDPNYGNNVIVTPQSGVWRKTGSKTFAVTLLHIEYHISTNPEPGSPVAQFTTLQYSGELIGTGDRMVFTALGTHYDLNGNQTDNFSFKGNGVRIPLTLLPNTINPLPIPPEPQ